MMSAPKTEVPTLGPADSTLPGVIQLRSLAIQRRLESEPR